MWASSLSELAGRWGPKLVIASAVVAVLQLAACTPNNASSFATVSSVAKSAASRPRLDSRALEYRLGTGDKVRLTIYNEPDLSGEFELDGTGRISLALLGKVKAGGLTVPKFEKTVQEKFRAYLKNPRLSVEVVNYRPFYIHGEVRSSGEYPYSNGLTVKNAIAKAGGYSYRAVTRYVLIRRANESGAKKYSLSDNVHILPGDNIFVPERIF